MQEEIIRQIVQNEMRKIVFHTHNGVDGTPRLDPTNFAPFTVYSTIPTDTSPNGTFKLVFDGANYRLYFRVNNLWKYVTLT